MRVNNVLGPPIDVKSCKATDIQRHFDIIKHWIPEYDHREFLARMFISARLGNAWKSDNCFLYYDKPDNPRIGHGIALYGMGHALELLGLFTVVFVLKDRNITAMLMKLHPGKLIKEYRSMISQSSIRRNAQDSSEPLVVKVQAFRKKIDPIWKKINNAL